MAKWKYKDIFTCGYCVIKLYTNSRRIYGLVKQHLDFNNVVKTRLDIKVSFYIEESNDHSNKDNNYLYNHHFNQTKTLSLALGSCIARVVADPQRQRVDGTIISYKESDKERLLDLIFFQPLRFILASLGLFFLHASMVRTNNGCLLISGPQCSGKSTISLVLAQEGFPLLSDDDCFIRLKGGVVKAFPFPTKMGLNDKILKKYPKLNKYTLKNYRYGGKKRLSLNHISEQSESGALKCAGIIFPVYRAGCKNIHLRRISSKEALNKLGREYLVLETKGYKEMFWALYSLTQQVSSFELTYNEIILDQIPAVIKRVCKF